MDEEKVVETVNNETIPVEVTEKKGGIMEKVKSKKKWIIAGVAAVGAIALVKLGKALGSKSEGEPDDGDFDDDFNDDIVDVDTTDLE